MEGVSTEDRTEIRRGEMIRTSRRGLRRVSFSSEMCIRSRCGLVPGIVDISSMMGRVNWCGHSKGHNEYTEQVSETPG